MATRMLPREEWDDYFGAFAHAMNPSGRVNYAVIRLAPSIGGRPVKTEQLPLHSLTYDAKDDLLEVVVASLGHFIYRPAALRVDDAEGRLRRLEIVRRDGACEVIELQPRDGHGDGPAAAPPPPPP